MEALRQKWNSSRGASILLALLFLLVCMMVGASILVAAASNAGKIRSNKEEQQKYLALSSALQLVCDELESVQYTGYYQVTTTIDTSRRKPVPEGSEPEYYTDITYTYQQLEGTLAHRETGAKVSADDWGTKGSGLQAVLPLFNDVDSIFAAQFDASKNVDDAATDRDRVSWKYVKKSSTASKYTLNITVNGGEAYGFQTVTITTTAMTGDGRIYLYASLDSDPSFRMRAMLLPDDAAKPSRLSVISRPSDDVGPIEYETEEVVTWTLREIVKEGAANTTPEGGGTDEETS